MRTALLVVLTNLAAACGGAGSNANGTYTTVVDSSTYDALSRPGTALDVFAPDGRYLGRVTGPRQFTAYAMRGNAVWGVLRDENDVPAVAKMEARLAR